MKINFTGVVLLSFGRNGKGGHAEFSSALTQQVCAAMGWPAEIPECLTGATPEGELQAESVELAPGQKEMAKHSLAFGVALVNGFSIVRREMEGKRGKGHTQELRYKVTFSDADGCKRLEQYFLTIGAGKGRMAVSYQKKAEQDELPLASEEQREAASEEED